jgi:Mg-chelatase subunit ChlD
LELTQPNGLWLLAALWPLVLLYVLRARRTRHVVPSVWLWQRARRDVLAQKPFKKLLPEVPLLLEALALALLAVALASPSCAGPVARKERVALIVDTSASMGVRGDAGMRIDEAKRAAEAAIARFVPPAEVMLIEAAAEPHVVLGLERDGRRLRRAVASLTVRDEEGALGPALALATERFRATPGPSRIVVVTDPAGVLPDGATGNVEVVRVGTPEANVALLRVETRRTLDAATAKERVEVFVSLANFGDTGAERFVTARARDGGRTLASRSIVLAAHERATATLGFDPATDDAGKGVVVELSPGDALDTDDRAFTLIPPSSRLPVVITPRDADPWLARAFAADDTVELFESDVAAIGKSAPAGALPRDALVVAVRTCPDEPPLGDLLVFAPPEGTCLGVHVGAPLENPALTSIAERDPRLRFLTLDSVRPRVVRPLTVPSGSALMRAGDAVVMADLGLAGRTGTLVSFDLKETAWPLDASFVVFVRNVTERAREGRLLALGARGRTGSPLRMPVRGDARRIVVRGPTGDVPARLVDAVATVGSPVKAGFYDVVDLDGATDAREPLATAVANLESERESDLAARPVVASAQVTETRATSVLSRVNGAFALALGALAVVVAEALWLTRRPRAPRAVAAGAVLRIGKPPAPPAPIASTSRSVRTAWASAPRSSRIVLGTSLGVALAAVADALGVRLGVVSDRFLRMERPGWTLAGLAALVVIAGRALVAPMTGGARSGARRPLVEGALSLAALAAAFAATEPSLGAAFDRLVVIVAVDRSRSMELSPGAEAAIEHELAVASDAMRPEDQLGVIGFATGAALEEPPRRRDEPRAAQRASLARDGTDLGAGIRRALAEAPSDAALRVVLVTDGVATRGNVEEATVSATIAGVPVDTIAIEQRPMKNVRLAGLRAPSHADASEALDLRVTTRATAATDVDVEVYRDGVRTGVARRHLPEGEDVLFVRETAGDPGLHRYEVRLVPTDPATNAIVEDDRATAFVRVQGRARALVLDTDADAAAPMLAALRAASFDATAVTATRAPETIVELASNDLVVLGAVPASDLTTEQVASLAAYVEALGGGLLLLGSDRSLGPGGYAKTPVEDVSPVSFELKNERRRARLAEVILIDYSGSMSAEAGGHTKLSLANDAAARSAELLGPVDRVGVAHVDTEVAWTLPLSLIGDVAATGRRIRGVTTGGGGIYVDLALEAAYRALEHEAVELKHVLLFADGDDAEERTRAPFLAENAARHGVTTSVVALGRGHDVAGLEQVSRQGRGRFYLIEDARRLPAVFAQETTTAAGNAVSEVAFRPSLRFASDALRGVDPQNLPPLGGYVVTTAKARATVALDAAEGDPLLATWQAGTGQVAAFTSDYGRKWGGAWAASPEAARLFAQLARQLARRGDDPRFSLDATVQGGTLDVRATRIERAASLDGAAPAHLVATVAGPDGFSERVPLEERGAGTLQATVPLGHAGNYVVTAVDDATHTVIGTVGAALSAAEELETTGTDHALLARIAASTGGTTRTTLAGIFRDRPASRGAYWPLSPWLIALAALALFSSVAVRRLSIPRPRWLMLVFERAQERARRVPSPRPDGGKTDPHGTRDTSLQSAATPSDGAAEPARDVHPVAAPTAPTAPTRDERKVPRQDLPAPQPTSTAEELLRRRKRRE